MRFFIHISMFTVFMVVMYIFGTLAAQFVIAPLFLIGSNFMGILAMLLVFIIAFIGGIEFGRFMSKL